MKTKKESVEYAPSDINEGAMKADGIEMNSAQGKPRIMYVLKSAFHKDFFTDVSLSTCFMMDSYDHKNLA